MWCHTCFCCCCCCCCCFITRHNWASTAETISFRSCWRSSTQTRSNFLLKLALDLMVGIWAGTEFHNWAIDGRNYLPLLAAWGHGHGCLASGDITTPGLPCSIYDGRGWLPQLPCGGSMVEYYDLHIHFSGQTNDTLSSILVRPRSSTQ